jgi:hypothetical protein
MNLTHVSDVKPRTVIQAQAQGVIKSSPNRLIEIHTKDLAMKKILPVLSTLLLTLSMGPAMADPWALGQPCGDAGPYPNFYRQPSCPWPGREAQRIRLQPQIRWLQPWLQAAWARLGTGSLGGSCCRWHHHLLGQQLHTSTCHRDCFATRGDRPRSGCLFLPNCPAILSKRANMQRALAVGELLNIKADGWFSRLGVVNGELCHPRSQPQHWLVCLDKPFA